MNDINHHLKLPPDHAILQEQVEIFHTSLKMTVVMGTPFLKLSENNISDSKRTLTIKSSPSVFL